MGFFGDMRQLFYSKQQLEMKKIECWPKTFYGVVEEGCTHLSFGQDNLFDTKGEADVYAGETARSKYTSNKPYVLEIKVLGYWKEIDRPLDFVVHAPQE